MKRYSILAFFGNITAAIGIIILLAGCDVIEPSERKQGNGVAIDSGIIKKVLVEDFTGFRCGNCPRAAEVALQLHDVFKDNVIVIAVHAGSQFAKPDPARFPKYLYDFTSPVGDETFPVFIAGAGQPNGTINRKRYNGTFPVNHDAWAAKVQTELQTKPGMSILLAPTYDTTSKLLTVKATVKYLSEGTSNHNIAMYLTEDSIVYYQKDYRKTPEDIPNYLHRHVLRGAVGEYGAYGKQLSTSAIAAGTTLEETFTLSFAGKDWKPEHCAVVGFVNDGTTKEVLQVEEAAVLGD